MRQQNELARTVVRMCVDHGNMSVDEGVDVLLAPALYVTHLSVALACARWTQCLGPDNTRDGRAAYAYVAGVMAGHHVTEDPRVVGV